jgi:transcriptional regulator with XRE-family HTH domain
MEDITERIKKIMDDNGLTPSQMADRIGVQRSAISHIISGRNRPSLDFVVKVLESFENVSSDWLLKGRNADVSTTLKGQSTGLTDPLKVHGSRSIEKVLVLYSDKTVEEYLK